MKYLFLGLVGAVVLYEIAARLSQRWERSGEDRYEDARLNRIRVLNQTGAPTEIGY